MAQLPRGDAEKLLRFVADAESLAGAEPFSTDLLDELTRVFGCEFSTFYTFDPVDRTFEGMVACSLEERYAAPLGENWQRLPEYVDVTHRVRMWSDALDRASRRRYESIWFARAFEVVDCVWTAIRLSPRRAAMINLGSQERDFGDRDRLCVGALRPHVAALVRNADARRRLDRLIAAVDTLDENEPQGFVLVQGDRTIDGASPSARRLLRRWFDSRGGALPDVLADWLTSAERRKPLVVAGVGRRLVVESPTEGELILREERAVRAALTPRELEILSCVAAGESTAEIARTLWITPSTVSKHLEHVYRKLGVRSRTAALAAAGIVARPVDQ